ncbi:hypothetical protein EB001_17980, partial [bacterium]|nr:hypothetical protein [bacterium]
GILEGIDTTGAADGDPVWLGTNGAKIYGLVNKPSAPSHLVFLGVVIRGGQANTGSMYVKIQNGFELEELHNVQISSLTNGNIISYDSTAGTWKNTNTLQSTSSIVPLIIKRVTSQTSDLLQWQDQTGGMLGTINKDGAITLNSSTSLGAALNVYTAYAGATGIIIKSSASQTADLVQIQNSSGTAIAGFSPIGQSFVQTTNPITSSAVSQSITSVSFTSTTATYTFSATAQTVSIGEYVTVYGISPSGYNGTYQVTAVATVSAGSSYSFTVANTTNTTVTTGTGYFFPSASLSISTQNKAHTALIIKAVSGQNASVMEIQNSLSQPVTWWDSNGGMTASQAVISTLYSGGFMNTGTLGYFNATTFNPATSPIVVRGAASQTANLQQWQNSAGTVLSAITSSGDLNFNSNLWNIKANGTNVIQWQPTTGTTFFGYGLSNTPITVQGSSGQTADLQKWQDSTGAVMSKISSGGDIYAISRSVLARFIQADNGAGAYIDLGFNNANSVSIVGRTSTTAPQLIVKAIASQTTDLQQWQDSAGNVLSSIKTDGSLYITGNSNAKFISGPSPSGTNQIISNGNDLAFSPFYDGLFAPANSSGRWRPVIDGTSDLGSSDRRWKDLYATAGVFTNNSTTKVGLIVKAIASQTSDIFQIQNSSGNAMWYVNQYGQLIGNQPFYLYNTQYIGAPTASSVPLTVRGTTSQTANLQEWQTVDGTIALRMTDYGKLFSNYLQSNYGILTGGATYTGGYNFISNPTFATTDTTLIVKAVTSQTSDLQQWQNSAGTSLVSISTGGVITSSAKIMYLDGGTFRIGYGGGNIGSNLAIGNTALNNNTTGIDNFALGSYSMYNTTTGGYNVAIGTGTLYWNVTGAGNTAIGGSALSNNTSSDNTAIGIMALVNSTSGYGNSGLGSGTLTSNTTANYNTAVGRSAGVMFTTGGNNTVVGATSFYHSSTTSTGINNTALGFGAGAGNTGSSNLFLGYSAGSQETGSNKLYITNSNTTTPLIGGDFSAKTLSFAGNTTITSQTAGTAGLVIYGASSQSVDLQQWKNNGGTTLARINQYGDLYITGGRIFRGPNDFGANLNISNESDLVGITIKGHTSQTVNLQEWQNSLERL